MCHVSAERAEAPEPTPMDSEDEEYARGEEGEYAAGYDEYAAQEAAPDEYYDEQPSPPPMPADGSEYADERGGVAYDFPGGGGPPAMASSFGSQAGGAMGASVSSLPEEIDVNTSGLIDETVQRLTFVHGVIGVLIVDSEGRIVHATMPAEEAAQLTGPTLQMLSRARAAVGSTPDDELSMLCVRTRKYEMLLCSEANGEYAVCVLQDPQPDNREAALVFEASKAARSLVSQSAATVT